MKTSILEKYPDFFSKKPSQIAQAIHDLKPYQIDPTVSTLLVWLTCFHQTKTISSLAYQIWQDAFSSQFNNIDFTEFNRKKNDNDERLIDLFTLVTSTSDSIFDTSVFAELFSTQLKPIHALPPKLHAKPLPKVLFNAQCFPQLSEITFENQTLEQFPEACFEFPALESLSICNCALQSLPPQIAQLTQLKQLILTGNQLKTLPLEITQLTQLVHLDVSDNQLGYIHPEIEHHFRHNRAIYYADNALFVLPKNKHLRSNDFHQWFDIYSQLTSWIEQAQELPLEQWHTDQAVEKTTRHTLTLFLICFFYQSKLIPTLPIDLSFRRLLDKQDNYNHFEKLLLMEVMVQQENFDQGLFQHLVDLLVAMIESHSLEELDQAFNLKLSIQNLPSQVIRSLNPASRLLPQVREANALLFKDRNDPWLKNLVHLTHLDLRFQNLTMVPPGVFELPHLQKLHLDNNNITFLPEDLAQLTQLKSLTLNENCLTQLPTAIGQLPQLKTLRVNYNQLKTFPQDVFWLPQLRAFEATNNAIETWPLMTGVPKQLHLTRILLAYNTLEALPETWEALPHLETLDVSHNQITRLPDGLGQLTKLKSLEINHNHLEYLPDYLQKFKLRKGFLANYLGEIPETFEAHCLVTLDKMPKKINNKELTQLLCIHFFYPKAEVRKAARKTLKKHLNPNELPEWHHRKIYYHPLIWFFLKLYAIKPKLDWQVCEAWIKRAGADPTTDQRIRVKEFITELVTAMPEVPYITWERIDCWIKRDQLRAREKFEYEGLIRFFHTISQMNPMAEWQQLHQWIVQTDALYLRKIAAIDFLTVIVEVSQNFNWLQWQMVDRWVKSVEIRIVHKMDYEQLLEQLAIHIQANPDLNWLQLGNCMIEAGALSSKRVDYTQFVIKMIQLLAKVPQLNWKMLSTWLTRVEEVSNKKGDNLELLKAFFGSRSLYQYLDESILESWMEQMQIRSSQPVELSQLFRAQFPAFVFKYWKSTSVNLSGNLLTAVPNGLRQNEQLESLNLSQNLISEFTEKDSKFLGDLKSINLAYNAFEQFPPSLMACKKLEWLNLSHNCVNQDLPVVVGQLPRLKHIDLSFNQLQTFPLQDASVFPKLTYLNLSFNYLVQIPDELAGFELLEKLDLSYNQLGANSKHLKQSSQYALPLKISFLEKLTHLYLQHNGLSQLPPGIGLIENLQVLDCNNNRFTEFPIEICESEKLKVLNFAHNKITYLPTDIQYMSALRKLDLSGNPLTTYEVRKIQQLIPHVKIIFDEYIPPTFKKVIPPSGKVTSSEAINSYDAGLNCLERADVKQALVHFAQAASKGDHQILYAIAQTIDKTNEASWPVQYWYTAAGLSGNASAQMILGDLANAPYEGFNQDQMVYWHTLAAQQKHLASQVKLARIYRQGQGMNKNIRYAMYWYKQAAEQNFPVAFESLAEIYETGEGVERDYTKAFFWYKKLAAQDHTLAQQKLAEFYHQGIGCDKNLEKAIVLYEQLDAKNIKIPWYTLAWGYYKGIGVYQDLDKALAYFQKSANHADISGQMMMGKLYLNGELTRKNFKKARKYFEIGDRKGNSEAQRLLGHMHEQGIGGDPNVRIAALFYEKAAQQGDIEAQYALGEILLQDHRELDQNQPLAKHWFQEAANQGHEPAKKRLGDIYANGWGVKKDEAMAGHWYSQVDSDLLGQ